MARRRYLPPLNGAVLKSARKISGKTMGEAAQICGCSIPTVVRLELGRDVGAVTYLRYCAAIGLNPYHGILESQRPPEPHPPVKSIEEILHDANR